MSPRASNSHTYLRLAERPSAMRESLLPRAEPPKIMPFRSRTTRPLRSPGSPFGRLNAAFRLCICNGPKPQSKKQDSWLHQVDFHPWGRRFPSEKSLALLLVHLRSILRRTARPSLLFVEPGTDVVDHLLLLFRGLALAFSSLLRVHQNPRVLENNLWEQIEDPRRSSGSNSNSRREDSNEI